LKHRKWIKLFFILPTLIVALILAVNYVIDPYSMTEFNLLNIPDKLARDDRVEKVSKLKSSPRYDNIILGSSRVYATNPLVVSKYLGGTTYNGGVGTATIEDHLGFILLLERLEKLPKNLIIGLDFYTFNKELETNKYFLKNKDLNFINSSVATQNYLSNFLSIDALRASYKTLKNHLKNKNEKARFDIHGAANGASEIFTYYAPQNTHKKEKIYSHADILKELGFIKTIQYSAISQKRIEYLEQIIAIAEKNNSKLFIYLTPIYGGLLEEVQKDKNLSTNLALLKQYLQERISFYDFVSHNSINDTALYFGDLTHVTPETGNLVYARLFHDSNQTLPEDFGSYRPKD